MRTRDNLCLLLLLQLVFTTGIAQKAPVTYQLQKDILYRTEAGLTDYMKERCLLDIYYPENTKDFTTIIWFHGGGITGGDKFIPEQWKAKGFCVVAANYRLHPHVKSPAYLEDAAAAVAWVVKNIGKYGGSTNKIVVSGHSAGGYLASMVGLDKSYLARHGLDPDQLAAYIPFSGHTVTHFTIRKEMGYTETQPIVDPYAPLYHVRADTAPFYLITGGREIEMLGRYEENAYFHRMMKVAGNKRTFLYELDGFDHGGMAVPGYELTLRILKELKL